MAVSGVSNFNPNVLEIMEEAASRAGFELRSGYQWESASRSMNLLTSEWANRGLNLWTIESNNNLLIAGTAQYDMGAAVDMLRMVVRDNGVDYPLERIGIGTYANIHNKEQTGRPLQVWVERLTDGPRINVWPVPDQNYSLVFWRVRRIFDAGIPTNTMDMPFRFLQAFICGLAYHLALKNPDISLEKTAALKIMYDEQLRLAQEEDRGKESFFISIWTRRPGR